MTSTNYTITIDGQEVVSTILIGKAVGAAMARAAVSGKSVTVVAHCPDKADREATFNPDGTNENIWNIDKGERIQPGVGRVYTNRGGGRYRCIAPAEPCAMYYNRADGRSNTSAVFQNVESGWTFTAKGVMQYIDGTIEWGHSIGGHFEEVRA